MSRKPYDTREYLVSIKYVPHFSAQLLLETFLPAIKSSQFSLEVQEETLAVFLSLWL
jgi:hypothetical protein